MKTLTLQVKMFAELLLSVAITLIAYAFYKFGAINNEYFPRRGIKSLKPTFFIGNSLIFRKLTAVELANQIYTEFPSES